MGIFGTVWNIVRHPLAYRVVMSIDEGLALIKASTEALADGKLTEKEMEDVLKKLDKLLKSLLGK